MISIVTTLEDGRIVEVRTTPESELELFPGAVVVNDHALLAGATHYINGELCRIEPEIPWQMKRRAGYPPLETLADALYWMNNGDSSKMDEYLEAVRVVKEQFPKG